MKRTTALLGALALLLFFAIPAAGNHDPIHAACKTNRSQLRPLIFAPGKLNKAQIQSVFNNSNGALCDSEPAPPSPPAPPPPPPPVPQGSSLRAKHVWNIGANYYVDSLNGNDSTGDGTSGAPWKTLQTVFTKLTNGAITWPAAGNDLAINIRPTAPYKAASSQRFTLDIFFSNTDFTNNRTPLSNRYLIWRKDPAYSTRPIINNPDGTSTDKIAIHVGSNANNNYQIWSELDVDGERLLKGTGAGGSGGFYIENGTRCEILDSKIHGFLIGVSQLNFTSQGIQFDSGASFLLMDRDEVYDNGRAGDHDPFSNHGVYARAADFQVTNSSFHDNQSGYGIQFYSSGAAASPRSVVANSTFDNNYASGILVHGDDDDIKIVNNIFTNHTGRGNGSYGIEFFPDGTGGAVGGVIDHNVYNGNSGISNSGKRDESPAGWTITNETVADPLYVSSSDRHLQSGSPAIGYTDTAYSFAYDLEGTARPAGAEDAGAYEFVLSAVAAEPPLASSTRSRPAKSYPQFIKFKGVR